MADEPDIDEKADEATASDVVPADEADTTDEPDAPAGEAAPARQRPRFRRLSRAATALTVGVALVAALAGLTGWLGYHAYEKQQAQAQRSLFVQIARQAAVNLTTINYTEVDADIKRVLDSATGAFHDEFQNRSQPFVEVVKKVQSKSEGTIAEAGLLSYTKDQGQVLIAVSVKTAMGTAPADPEPRRWRMRLTVDKTGDGAKVSNVEFVP
jgi:Mce-associated membrane protein